MSRKISDKDIEEELTWLIKRRNTRGAKMYDMLAELQKYRKASVEYSDFLVCSDSSDCLDKFIELFDF